MDLSRAVYSRDLKIAAMRALDAGATGRGDCAQISGESSFVGTLARRMAGQGRSWHFKELGAARRRVAGRG